MQPSRKLSVILTAALLPACSVAVRHDSPLRPVATLQEIMTAVIDPNIDPVWNAVSTVSTVHGVEERRPRTDEEWKRLRQHALTVAEAANMLRIPGRPVAAPGAATSSGGAELNPDDIRKAIAADPDAYAQRAAGLQGAARRLIAAIDRKNAEELVEAGGHVEQACEQCHSQFWYPGDKRPK